MRSDQCGVANPEGVVALTAGLANEVSGDFAGRVSVTVSPVEATGDCAWSSSCAVANAPLRPMPSAAITTVAPIPTTADINFSSR